MNEKKLTRWQNKAVANALCALGEQGVSSERLELTRKRLVKELLELNRQTSRGWLGIWRRSR